MTNRPLPHREIPIADIHKTFSDQIGTLDPQRAQSVNDLATVRSAKAATLAHEQNLLTRKLGAKDPRIAALAQQQARNATLQAALAAEATRAQTPAPTVDAQSYIFHGFVLDAKRQPLPRLSVALYNEQGQWVSELGYGCTDERGYFLMRYDRDQQPKPTPTPAPQPAPAPPPVPQSAPSPAAGGKLFGATAPNMVAETPSFNILVFDPQQKLLYRDPQPLQPQLGRVDYRVIIIGDTAGTCAPPPGSTSPDATPDQKSSGTTATRDIASIRKQAVPKRVQVSSKIPVPGQVPPDVAARKKTAAAARRPGKKSRPTKPDEPKPPKPTSTPLEAIRGIGPARARKLRAAGIKDVETLLQTDAAKLVEIAGVDARVVKREAAKALKKAKEK